MPLNRFPKRKKFFSWQWKRESQREKAHHKAITKHAPAIQRRTPTTNADTTEALVDVTEGFSGNIFPLFPLIVNSTLELSKTVSIEARNGEKICHQFDIQILLHSQSSPPSHPAIMWDERKIIKSDMERAADFHHARFLCKRRWRRMFYRCLVSTSFISIFIWIQITFLRLLPPSLQRIHNIFLRLSSRNIDTLNQNKSIFELVLSWKRTELVTWIYVRQKKCQKSEVQLLILRL